MIRAIVNLGGLTLLFFLLNCNTQKQYNDIIGDNQEDSPITYEVNEITEEFYNFDTADYSFDSIKDNLLPQNDTSTNDTNEDATLSCIPLGQENVRTPNYNKTGDSLYRSNFNSYLVPLTAPNLTFIGEEGCRTESPTEVRIVLDKIEAIVEGMVQDNKVTFLGFPERVTLLPGDRLTIITWNGNYTGSITPIITGFSLGGILIEELLENIEVFPARGSGAVSSVVANAPVYKGYGYFSQRLSNNQHGGAILTGSVKNNRTGLWVIEVQEVVAFSNQILSDSITIDYQTAISMYQALGRNPTLHQQGQYYGDYIGEISLGASSRVTIAAPGSWAYHGTDFLGNIDPDYKQAAYWVPIHVILHNTNPQPTTFSIITSSGNYADPNAVELLAEYPNGSSQMLFPYQSYPLPNDITLHITFLGGSATALAIETQ